jgi:hypothetical protein
MDPFKTNVIKETMIESNNASEVMEQILDKQEREKQLLLSLETIMNN